VLADNTVRYVVGKLQMALVSTSCDHKTVGYRGWKLLFMCC